MKGSILRTGSGSIPVLTGTAPSSARVAVSLPVNETVGSGGEKNPPAISLQLVKSQGIRRVSSETDVIRFLSAIEPSGGIRSFNRVGSRSFPAKILEDEGNGSLSLMENRRGYAGNWPGSGIPLEELGSTGDGTGKNCSPGGGGDEYNNGGFDDGSGDRGKIGLHYEQMIKSDPANALFLMNYGKYLYEVEKNLVKAEEYYGRAILASSEDGELLSLYGKFIWETQKDENRAKSYFMQALHASPMDCEVLGSYARFMWEADKKEEEEKALAMAEGSISGAAAMVNAY